MLPHPPPPPQEVVLLFGLHPLRLLERPLPERGTTLRSGGGKPPEIRRPSGPKEEEFLRPPSIVISDGYRIRQCVSTPLLVDAS